MLSSSSATTDAITAFSNAFHSHRSILTGFAKCANKDELHLVRDGFYFAMASDLGLTDRVKINVLTDPLVNATAADSSFQRTVESARSSCSDDWDAMMQALQRKAEAVGSDLDGIWMGLEQGRLEWLAAVSAAHPIKVTLQKALKKDGGGEEGDVSDAKMIWMYALALSIPVLQEASTIWQGVVQMKDKKRPFVGYDPELWDSRKPEWAPLDLGAQTVAERGGSSIEEGWKA